MKFSLLFFNMIFIKKYEQVPIQNLFLNKNLEKIGYINQKGDLYYLNSEKKEKKYGNLDVKENKIFHYTENGSKWCITTPFRSYLSSKGYYKKPSSNMIFSDFSDCFFQVFSNGQILKDGKEVNTKVQRQNLWTSAIVHDGEHVLYMDEKSKFRIHHITHDYEMFQDEYQINSVGQKIRVSKKGHFINVYILYPKYGIRVLRFFGGFNNFINAFFLSIPDCKDFSCSYPRLSVITEGGFLKIWNVQHNQKYEMIYSRFYEDLKEDIEEVLEWNKIIYVKRKKVLLEFLLLPI